MMLLTKIFSLLFAFTAVFVTSAQNCYTGISDLTNPGSYETTTLTDRICRYQCLIRGNTTSYAALIQAESSSNEPEFICMCSSTVGTSINGSFCYDTCPSSGTPCGGGSDDTSQYFSVYQQPCSPTISYSVNTATANAVNLATAMYSCSRAGSVIANATVIYDHRYPSELFVQGANLTTSTTSRTLRFAYRTPGYAVVKESIVTGELDTTTSTNLLLIQQNVGSISPIPLSYVLFNKTYDMQLSITLTSSATITIKIGNYFTGTSKILSSYQYMLGSSFGIQTNQVVQSSQPAMVWLLPAMTITRNSTIIDIRFQRTGTYNEAASNVFYLQIYRPSCSNGYTYCYVRNLCIPAQDNCTPPVSNQRSKSCSAADTKFSVNFRTCVNLTSNEPISNQQQTALDFSLYYLAFDLPLSFVTAQALTTDANDYLINVLQQNLLLQPGDVPAIYQSDASSYVLAVGAGSSVLASTSTMPSWITRSGNYSQSYTNILLTNFNLLVQTSQPLVSFSLAQTVNITVPVIYATHVCAASPIGCFVDDQYNVSVAVSNGFASTQVSNLMHVFMGISDINANLSNLTSSFVQYKFQIPLHIGSYPNYVVNFGDNQGNITGLSFTGNIISVSHFYILAGTYTTTLYAYNLLTSKVITQSVLVQDVIVGLQVFALNYPAGTINASVQFVITVTQGSRSNCTLNFGDGSNPITFNFDPNPTPVSLTSIAYFIKINGAKQRYGLSISSNIMILEDCAKTCLMSTSDTFYCQMFTFDTTVAVSPCTLYSNEIDMLPNFALAWTASSTTLYTLQNSSCFPDLLGAIAYTVNASSGITENGVRLTDPGWTNSSDTPAIMFGFSTFVQIYVIRVGAVNNSVPTILNVSMSNDTFNWTPYPVLLSISPPQSGQISTSVSLNPPIVTRFLQLSITNYSGQPAAKFAFSGCVMQGFQYMVNHTYNLNMTSVKNITVSGTNDVSTTSVVFPFYLDVSITNLSLTSLQDSAYIFTNMSLPFRVSGVWGSYLEVIIQLHDNSIVVNQTFTTYQPYYDFNITFTEGNQWYLNVNVSNYVSSATYSLLDPVTVIGLVGAGCNVPYVDLIVPNACVPKITCTQFGKLQAMTVARSNTLTVRSNTTNFCSNAALFSWTVESCSDYKTCVDYTPQITKIYAAYYPNEMPVYNGTNINNLVFNPRTFDVGYYRFSLSVTISGDIDNATNTKPETLVGRSNPTYFYVSKSKLIACINNFTFSLSSPMDRNLNLTLDASCSSDPDVWSSNDYNLNYYWSCYRDCETPPRYDPVTYEFIPWSNASIYKSSCSYFNSRNLTYSNTGCFLPFGLHLSGPLVPRSSSDYDWSDPRNAMTGTGNSNASLYGTANYNQRSDIQDMKWAYVTSADNKSVTALTYAMFYKTPLYFIVTIAKQNDTRRTQALVIVTLSGQLPPSLKVGCYANCFTSLLASPLTAQFIVDPNAPFKLYSTILNYLFSNTYYYKWTLCNTNGTSAQGITYDEVTKIVLNPLQCAVNDYNWNRSSTGVFSPGISFDSLYPIFPTSYVSKLMALAINITSCTSDTTSTCLTSVAYYLFTVNKLPETEKVIVTVNPAIGRAMMTNHTILCVGGGGNPETFPLTYSIGYTTYADENAVDNTVIMDYAKQCTWITLNQRTCVYPGSLMLPLGNVTMNYTLFVCIGITDAVGSTSYAFFPKFQIFPADLDGRQLTQTAATLSKVLAANFNSYAPLASALLRTIMPPKYTYDSINSSVACDDPACSSMTTADSSITTTSNPSATTYAPPVTTSDEENMLIVYCVLSSLQNAPNCTDVYCLQQLASLIQESTAIAQNLNATSIRLAINITKKFAVNLQALVSGGGSSININTIVAIASSVISGQTTIIAQSNVIISAAENCTICPLTRDDLRQLSDACNSIKNSISLAMLSGKVPNEGPTILNANYSVQTIVLTNLTKMTIQPNPDTCNKFILGSVQSLFSKSANDTPAYVQYCNKQSRDNQYLFVDGASNFNQTQEMEFMLNGVEYSITNASGDSTFEIWMDTGLDPSNFPTLNANLTPYTLPYGKSMLTHKVFVKADTNLFVNVQHYLNWTSIPVNVTVNGTTQLDYVQILQNNASYNASNVLFIVYIQKSKKPTDTDYLANCTLPNFNLDDLNCAQQDQTNYSTNATDLFSMYENLKNLTELKFYETLIDPIPTTRCTRFSQSMLNPWTCIFTADIMNNTNDSTYYVGVRAIQWNWTLPFDNDTYNPNITNPAAPTAIDSTDYSVPANAWIYLDLNYTFFAYYAGCFFFDQNSSTFSSDGCSIGKCSSPYATQCFCNHLTSFSNMFRLPPIGFDITSLNINALNNSPGVMCFLVAIFCAYCVVWIWARYADLTAEEKLGVTYLPSNDPIDPYAYEITVWTGNTPGSGTSSNVSIILAGDSCETEGRWLGNSDENHKAFQRGSIDMFLLTTLNWLGPLSHIKVWHDNSGSHPSWYLMRILIRDLHTQTKYYFIINDWFSIKSDDGALCRLVPVAGKKDLRQVKNVFLTRASSNLLDGHMWLSVATRPSRSRFTRVQRLTCCLVICLTAVLFNLLGFIVKFKSSQEAATSSSDPDPPIIVLGPISITSFQLTVSMISSIGSIPINMIIAMLFQQRRIRGNANHSDPYDRYTNFDKLKDEEKAVQEQKQKAIMEAEKEAADEMNACERCTDACSDAVAACIARILPFPWWSHYVAYTLAAITSGTAFFCASVLAYSNLPEEWQQNAWLSTIILSLVQSIFIVQPLQIFLIVLAFSLIIRLPQEDTDEMSKEVAVRRPLVDIPDKKDNSVPQVQLTPKQPLSTGFTQILHDQQKDEEHLQATLTGLAFFVFFLILLFFAMYTFSSPWRYNQNNFAKFYQQLPLLYDKSDAISSVDEVWQHLSFKLLPFLYSQNISVYNSVSNISNSSDSNTTATMFSRTIYPYQMPNSFTADGTLYLQGARLRQLRVAKSSCTIPDLMTTIVTSCYGEGWFMSYDTGNYDYNWMPLSNNASSNVTVNTPFTYVQADLMTQLIEIAGPFLFDAGYTATLARDLKTSQSLLANLSANNWIDPKSRKIFIDILAYNPSTRLFVVSSSLVDLASTGLRYSHSVHSLWLDRYGGINGGVSVITEVLAGLGLLIFIIKTFASVCTRNKKEKISFGAIFDLILSAVAIINFALFATLIVLSLNAENSLKKASNTFVNLQSVCFVEKLTRFTFGLVVALMYVRIAKYLQFIRRLRIIFNSIAAGSKICLSILFYLVVTWLTFASVCFLVYFNYAEYYSTIMRTICSLLMTFLCSFDFESLNSGKNAFGTTMFVIYAWLVVFILARSYVAALAWSLRKTRAKYRNEKDEYNSSNDPLKYVLWKCQAFCGCELPSEDDLNFEYLSGSLDHEELCKSFQVKCNNFEHLVNNAFVDDMIPQLDEDERSARFSRTISEPIITD